MLFVDWMMERWSSKQKKGEPSFRFRAPWLSFFLLGDFFMKSTKEKRIHYLVMWIGLFSFLLLFVPFFFFFLVFGLIFDRWHSSYKKKVSCAMRFMQSRMFAQWWRTRPCYCYGDRKRAKGKIRNRISIIGRQNHFLRDTETANRSILVDGALIVAWRPALAGAAHHEMERTNERHFRMKRNIQTKK